MKILITGMSGVGKSTLCTHLKQIGYTAFDLDDIPNLCKLYHSNGKAVSDDENRVKLNMLEIDYLCDTTALEKHIESQLNHVFYVGYVDNFSEVAKYFDQVFLLTITPEENKRRMSIRTTTDFATDEKTQNELMEFKEEWEESVKDYGATAVDASKETESIANDILEILNI